MNIISIIPARGGSKRLPKKNIMDLSGKPLIAYTIGASRECNLIDRTIVSTENDEIKSVSEKYGAEVIKRPIELAGDASPTIDTVMHVVETLENEGYVPDIIVLLQPTSPLRDSKDILDALEMFKTGKFGSVVSAKPSNPLWNFSLEDGKVKPILGWEFIRKRKQDLPEYYSPNGAIYIITPKTLRERKAFYFETTGAYIMPEEKSVDIDTLTDFRIAEAILQSMKGSPGKDKNHR